jgi:uncharacterized protein
MRLVDTSAWIEALAGSPLGLKAAAQFPEKNAWLVPTIVQLELAKWVNRYGDKERLDDIIATTRTCVVAPLDTKVAMSAAELCQAKKLATADAIIYATALEYGADLLTCDAHFEGLESVIYMAKKDR